MTVKLRGPLAIVVALGLTITASAAAQEKPFEPVVGQAGKDVVWVPTSPALVEKMLDMAQVTPQDIVMDLGSGDGRNVIAAARRGATRHRRRVQSRDGGAVQPAGEGSGRRRQSDVHRGGHVHGGHLEGDRDGAVSAARQP